MPLDSEKLKVLLNLKGRLEQRIKELENEMKEATATLEAVNAVLLEKGFKRGDLKEVKATATEAPVEAAILSEEATVEQRAMEPENVIPLKTMNEEPLAIIYVDKQELHVLPDERKKFSISTPPFQNFLVERVLVKMQEKDSDLVRNGQMEPEKMFAFNIIHEGDLLREIVIRNVDDTRLKELKSSIRWTLEKMYEKMKSQV
ncbi:MAG: hypothetical protein N3E52_02045 [Candidatus Bathyarchaeota archaeon]|nr:hypothetical protein [Candidatus Bathyarchaeota archaeon]